MWQICFLPGPGGGAPGPGMLPRLGTEVAVETRARQAWGLQSLALREPGHCSVPALILVNSATGHRGSNLSREALEGLWTCEVQASG